MLIHKGEILDIAIRKISKGVTDIAEKVGYTRKQVYNHFHDANLPDHIIRKYAEAFNYNFREEFPELYSKWVLEEPPLDYALHKTAEMLQSDLNRYRDMYIKTLEEKNQITLELADCRKQLAQTVSHKN